MTSDKNADTTETATILANLKEQADMLDITYHPSIGIEKLRAKVAAKAANVMPPVQTAPIEPVVAKPTLTEEQLKRKEINDARKAAGALHRVRVACMNPAKQEWEGEIFIAGSTLMGTHKKYVPFNNEEGWHVPQIILTMMEERQCQVFQNGTDQKGRKTKETKMIKEFNIDYLDPLTKEELDALAKKQAMANNLG